MRESSLAEGAAAHAPASGAAGKRKLHGARGLAFEAGAEAEFAGGEAEQALGGAGEQAFAGAIDEAQFVFVVEGKNGDVDFFHDRAEQPGGFQRAEALLA